MKCLFCGGETLTLRYRGIPDRLKVSKKSRRILQCSICGSLQPEPVPSASEIPSLYPEGYSFKENIGGKTRGIWNILEWQIFYAPVLRCCVELVKKVTGINRGKLLDIGCGSGLRILQFKLSGFTVYGCDFSETDIAYAKQKGLSVTRVNIEEEELTGGPYDVVIAYWLVEHLREPSALVHKIYRILNPGGWVVLGIPLSDSLVARLFGGRWSSVREIPRHIGIPSRKGMSIILKKAGFQKICYQPVSSLELAGDLALTLWPRGNFVLTQKKHFLIGITDRVFTGFLTLLCLPLVFVLRTIGIPQSLSVYFAQKTNAGNQC